MIANKCMKFKQYLGNNFLCLPAFLLLMMIITSNYINRGNEGSRLPPLPFSAPSLLCPPLWVLSLGAADLCITLRLSTTLQLCIAGYLH